MGSKVFCVLTAMVVMIGLGLPVQAAEGKGEIRVTLDFGDGEVHDSSVILCRVAVPEEEHFRLMEAYGGGLVKREDAVSDALASWLAETALREEKTRILDADGSACFTGLQDGLYLLVQSENSPGLDPFKPILILMPSSNQWDLVVWPQQRKILAQYPQTGQPVIPLVGAMGIVVCGIGLLLCLEKIRRK